MSTIEPKLIATWFEENGKYKPKVLEVTPGGPERLVIDETYTTQAQAEARAEEVIELMKKGEWHDNS